MTDSGRPRVWAGWEDLDEDFSEDSMRVIWVIFFLSFSVADSDEAVARARGQISETISRFV